jgi:sulfatase modifying factor 1
MKMRPLLSAPASLLLFLILLATALLPVTAPAQAPAPAVEALIQLDLGGGVVMELIRIEPGTFTQGSPASETGRGTDEQTREVKITKPFYIGKYPVTRAQWQRFITEKSYRTEAEDGVSGGYGWDGQKLVQGKGFTWRNPGFPQTGEHPVTLVTWPDAQAFLKWLGTRTGRVCALPTEAQWEYACRAGTTTPWPLDNVDDWAWHKGNAGGGTHPVGQKKPNALGLMDMSGQVWEWCQDWYGPWDATAVTDPLQTNDRLSDKPRRVLRGGSFTREPNNTRSAARYRNDARSRNADNGFRVVAQVTPVRPATAPPTTNPPPPSTPPPPVRIPDSPNTTSDAPHAPSPYSDHDSPVPSSQNSSGGSVNWIAWVIAAVGLVVVWKVIRTLRSRVGGAESRPGFKQWSSALSAAAPAGAPSARVGKDGFWITGDMPAGSPVFWRWHAGGQVLSGQGEYQPGPEGMFIFTGAAPESAQAWLAGAEPADHPLWGEHQQHQQDRTSSYRTGVGAGMLHDRLEREREQERQRQGDREDEERRRRRRDHDHDFQRPPSSPSSTRSSGFPSAY